MARRRSGAPPHPISSKFITSPQQKMLSMWQHSSPTLSKMATDIDVAEACLKKMEDCSAVANAPAKADDDLRSAFLVSKDCIEKMKKCEQFVDESLSLELYVKEQSKTKAMLLLIKYGNVSEFESRAKSAIDLLSKRNENLVAYREILSHTVESASCICEKCWGTGIIEEQKVIRDFGSPPSVIISTSSCTACKGSGKVNLALSLTRNLEVFLDKLNDVLHVISENMISANNAISTSLKAIKRDSSVNL
jgi:hypothetical protein